MAGRSRETGEVPGPEEPGRPVGLAARPTSLGWGMRMPSAATACKSHRTRHVLQLHVSQRHGWQSGLVLQLISDLIRNDDAARGPDGFEPGCHVDRVSVGPLVVVGDVARVDADPEWDLRVRLELALDLDGAGDRLHGAREDAQRAVTEGLEESAAVFRDGCLDHAVVPGPDRLGLRLVPLHEGGVADHVREHHRREVAWAGSRHDSSCFSINRVAPGAESPQRDPIGLDRTTISRKAPVLAPARSTGRPGCRWHTLRSWRSRGRTCRSPRTTSGCPSPAAFPE